MSCFYFFYSSRLCLNALFPFLSVLLSRPDGGPPTHTQASATSERHLEGPPFDRDRWWWFFRFHVLCFCQSIKRLGLKQLFISSTYLPAAAKLTVGSWNILSSGRFSYFLSIPDDSVESLSNPPSFHNPPFGFPICLLSHCLTYTSFSFFPPFYSLEPFPQFLELLALGDKDMSKWSLLETLCLPLFDDSPTPHLHVPGFVQITLLSASLQDLSAFPSFSFHFICSFYYLVRCHHTQPAKPVFTHFAVSQLPIFLQERKHFSLDNKSCNLPSPDGWYSECLLHTLFHLFLALLPTGNEKNHIILPTTGFWPLSMYVFGNPLTLCFPHPTNGSTHKLIHLSSPDIPASSSHSAPILVHLLPPDWPDWGTVPLALLFPNPSYYLQPEKAHSPPVPLQPVEVGRTSLPDLRPRNSAPPGCPHLPQWSAVRSLSPGTWLPPCLSIFTF